MAATAVLDDNSHAHWKEKLYDVAHARTETNSFASEAQKLGFMEGKVGLRESNAMKNIAPNNKQ